MKEKLKIAVRDLVEYVLRSGDLRSGFMGASRAAEAIRAHQKIQKSRPENYSPEVPLSHQIETDRFSLTISGRADGIFHNPDRDHSDRVIIDEIKTTTRNPAYFYSEDFEHEENPRHWGQVKVYAYIYAAGHSMDEIGAQLTYYHMDTRGIREFRKNFAQNALKKFFDDILNSYLEWAETLAVWRGMRDPSIRELSFPFADYRPGQRRMAVEAYRTIRDKGQLIVQAPTGIGKTMAAIFPAVKATAEGLHSKIFYLTARTTGRIAAEKAISELRKGGLRIKSLTLTAKDKICPNPESACNPDECPLARGYYDRVTAAVRYIFQQDAFTKESIEKTALTHEICPFEFSLELSLWADCIICDYNYAFDPKVFLKRFFAEGNRDYTFLIDEAHNLAERSREMFSAQIMKQPFLNVRRLLRHELPRLYKSMGKINSRIVKARKKCEASGTPVSEKDPPDDLYPLLRNFLRITESWLARNIGAAFREELTELYFSVTGFMNVAEQYDETYATCFEQIRNDLSVKLFCIDPSRQMEEALKRCSAAVFFSATMTPYEYFRKILGCGEAAGRLTLSSPFPPRNLGLFISDRISVFYKHRDQTKSAVCEVILTLVSRKKGNYLLFFPSYKYMWMVHELFMQENPGAEILVQSPGMTEPERDEFLKRFAGKDSQSLIGFAVMGGIFGEGIDLVGDRLSGAVIVGVGLPGICLERELIREYFANTHGKGFEYAYIYPGINRVLQAAGRVIRSEKDRGVVLLIDQRFASFQYKHLLPSEWLPVRVRNEKQFEKDLEQFWERAP
ncbi:helicase C-terminal domain-containing protein [Desulfococcaceae bacterium HSG8]|nr:helicase C-terminal domain-containing protein [Desulfococcaceae bacterium HSG8]